MRQKLTFFLVFWAIAAALGWWYGYADIYPKTIISAHLWRQGDCAGLARNYYYDGLDFWQPRMMNSFGKDGRSVGEFPLTYYLAACWYKLAGGPSEGLMRLWHWLIFASGCYGFGLMVRDLTRKFWWGIGFGLLLLTSPLNAFYSFNFLTDAPAFGFLLLSVYALWCAVRSGMSGAMRRHRWQMLASVLLLSLAGLLKVTMLVWWVALGAMWMLEALGLVRMLSARGRSGPAQPETTEGGPSDQRAAQHPVPRQAVETAQAEHAPQKRKNNGWLFPERGFAALLLLLPPLFSGWWYWWAHRYNAMHSPYLLMELMPIWKMSAAQVAQVWTRIRLDWHWVYFHPAVSLPTLLATVWVLATPRRQLPVLFWATLLTFLGSLALVLLWFEQLYHHDYYAIVWMMWPVATWLAVLWHWRERHTGPAWTLGLAGLLLFNANHARKEMLLRYDPEGGYIKFGFPSVMFDQPKLQTWLKKNGLRRGQKVVSVPDISPNATLYLYDLTGLTHYSFEADRRYLPTDSIEVFARRGYDFMLVNDRPTVLKDSTRTRVMRHPIDSLDSVIFLYDLRPIGRGQ